MKVKGLKNTIAVLLSAATVLQFSGFAEAVQTGETSVKITGNVGKAEVCDYTIDVYAPGKSWLDIDTAFGVANTDVLVYHNQLETNADGSYTVEFDMTGNSGEYQVLVYADGVGVDDSQTLVFRKAADIKAAVTALNAIAADDAKTFDDFAEYAEDNAVILGFEFDGLSGYNQLSALEILYKSSPVDGNDINASGKAYRQACIVSEVNSGNISDVFAYSEHFAEDVENLGKYLDEEAEGFVLTQTMKTNITSRLKTEDCESIEEFLDKTAEVVVLEAFTAPNGVDNLKMVIADFEYATGIAVNDYDTATLNAVTGSSLNSIEELIEALDEAKENPLNGGGSTPSGGSGGGNGGGGGGSSSGSGHNVVVTKQDESNKAVETIPEDVYVDIDGVAWAKDAIIGLTEKGIVNGKAKELFAPDDIVLREEFVKMLVMAFAKDVEAEAVSFADVSKSEWYYEYVAKAVSAGLIKGYSDKEFGTGQPISRQDIAVTLYRAVYQGQSTEDYELVFMDTETIADYALEAVKVLNKDGIINGMGNNRFCPEENATRAQAVKMIYEILER